MQIVQESLTCLPELSKPRRKFMLEMFSLLLSLRGRANYRNLSRYSDYEEKTFQRNARKPFPFQALNVKLAEQTLSDSCVLVGDEVLPFVKTGNHATLVPCSEAWTK